MTNITTFEALETTFGLAEEGLITRGELTVDPTFQMREEMDHSVIDDYVEVLDKLPPVKVFEVEHALGTDLILADGFHRFFANEKAESPDIRAKVIKGTREEAMTYAMVANFVHLRGGSKPTKNDQKKAILSLCEELKDSFGYDSKNVVKQLKELGVSASKRWMETCTREVREEVDSRRDTAIKELAGQGESGRAIASTLGVPETTVRRILSAPKTHSAQTAQPEASEEPTFDSIPFPEEEDEAPVINPAEAESKVLQQFDEELAESNAESADDTTSPSSASVVISTDSSISDETVMLQVEDAFQHLIDAWETHGKEGFDTFLKSEREAFLSLAGGVGMSLK